VRRAVVIIPLQVATVAEPPALGCRCVNCRVQGLR